MKKRSNTSGLAGIILVLVALFLSGPRDAHASLICLRPDRRGYAPCPANKPGPTVAPKVVARTVAVAGRIFFNGVHLKSGAAVKVSPVDPTLGSEVTSRIDPSFPIYLASLGLYDEFTSYIDYTFSLQFDDKAYAGSINILSYTLAPQTGDINQDLYFTGRLVSPKYPLLGETNSSPTPTPVPIFNPLPPQTPAATYRPDVVVPRVTALAKPLPKTTTLVAPSLTPAPAASEIPSLVEATPVGLWSSVFNWLKLLIY